MLSIRCIPSVLLPNQKQTPSGVGDIRMEWLQPPAHPPPWDLISAGGATHLPHPCPGAHQLLYSGSAPPGCSTVLLCETGCVRLIHNNSFSSSVSPPLPASFPSRSLFYLIEGQPCFLLVSTYMEYLLPSITSSQHVSLS